MKALVQLFLPLELNGVLKELKPAKIHWEEPGLK